MPKSLLAIMGNISFKSIANYIYAKFLRWQWCFLHLDNRKNFFIQFIRPLRGV